MIVFLQLYTKYPFFQQEHDFRSTDPMELRTTELLACFPQPQEVMGLGKFRFQKVPVCYCVRFFLAQLDADKPAIIIPTRDQIPLVTRALDNLRDMEVVRHGNVVVVDDRSSRGEALQALCEDRGVSYIRVDNGKGFNFSMLNNIAAHCAYQLGLREIVLWNSDLLTPSPEAFPHLLAAHRQGGHTLTGTRLLYPPEALADEGAKAFLRQHNPRRETSHWGRVQFGGSAFLHKRYSPSHETYVAHHLGRFQPADHPRALTDRPEVFVTGAFCIIDLQWFVEAGGLNISLAKTNQDVDLCLRANEQGRTVMYLGREHFMYHDEAVTQLAEGLEDRQFAGDALLYAVTWKAERVAKLLTDHAGAAGGAPRVEPRPSPGTCAAGKDTRPPSRAPDTAPITVETRQLGEGLPVSVVVPLADQRRGFFERFCLPSILVNRPQQVTLVTGEGGAARKRNAGFQAVDTPYVLFCDDDVVLPADYLPRLLQALEAGGGEHGYAYGDYVGICIPPASHPLGPVFTQPGRPFDAQALRAGNYISTMSLMRSEVFVGFDEQLQRLQDWDLWLTLLERGVTGQYVPGAVFHAYYLDSGITARVDLRQAHRAIRLKHDLAQVRGPQGTVSRFRHGQGAAGP